MGAWNHREDRHRGCCAILSHPCIRGLWYRMFIIQQQQQQQQPAKRTIVAGHHGERKYPPDNHRRRRTGSVMTRIVRLLLFPTRAAVAWCNPSCMIDTRGMSLPMSSTSIMIKRISSISVSTNIWPVPKVRPDDPLVMCCVACWKSFRNIHLAGGTRAMIEKQGSHERGLIFLLLS